MKRCLHILFLLVAVVQLYAQAPGYLGKRFYVRTDGQLGIAFGATANNRGLDYYGDDGGGLGWDTRYGLQVGYATSRRHVLSLTANYLKTGMYATMYTPVVNYPTDYDFDDHYLFYNLKGMTYGLGYQWFKVRKGAIAPFGVFFGLHLQASMLKGDILDKQTSYYYSDGLKIHAPLGVSPKYTYKSVGLEFGQNSIIKDRIVLSYSCQFNLPFLNGKFTEWVEDDEYDVPYDSSEYLGFNQNEFELRTYDRMLAHSLVALRLGVGLLIF